MKPLIRWVGGKSAMIKHIDPPQDYERYHEPFGGGLAMFFNLPDRPDKELPAISDNNMHLMNFYHVVSLTPALPSLLTNIMILKDTYDDAEDQKSRYYEMRDELNALVESQSKDMVWMAALFYVINRTCFNGLWRTSSTGRVNTPHDKSKTSILFDPEAFAQASKKLSQAWITCQGYEMSLKGVLRNDWVFADPPYYDVYNKYSRGGFSAADHILLAKHIRSLDRAGAYVTVTNRDCPEVREMYDGFHMQVITQNNNVNSNASGRKDGRVDLIITNYGSVS